MLGSGGCRSYKDLSFLHTSGFYPRSSQTALGGSSMHASTFSPRGSDHADINRSRVASLTGAIFPATARLREVVLLPGKNVIVINA